jgi:hypothetical protein
MYAHTCTHFFNEWAQDNAYFIDKEENNRLAGQDKKKKKNNQVVILPESPSVTQRKLSHYNYIRKYKRSMTSHSNSM